MAGSKYQHFLAGFSKAAVVLFSFLAAGSTAGMNIGFGFIALASLLDPAFYRRLIRSRYFFVFLSFALYLVLNSYLINNFPEPNKAKFIKSYLMLFLFPVFFWVLRNANVKIRRIFSLFIVGTLLHVIFSPGFLSSLAEFKRTGYHLPIIFFSLLCSLICLWCLIFLNKSIFEFGLSSKKIEIIIFSITFIIFFVFLIQTRTRTSWLPVMVLTPFLFFFQFKIFLKNFFQKKSAVVASVLGLVLVLSLFSGALSQRIGHSMESIRNIEVGTQEGVEKTSSINNRYNLLLIGIRAVAEKPLFGHGVGSTERINLSQKNQYAKLVQEGRIRGFDNFHSFYLEVASQLGIPVLLFLLWGIYSFFKRYRECWLASETNLFLLFGALLIVGWSLFEARHFHSDFRNFWIFFMGLSLYHLEGERGGVVGSPGAKTS